MPNPYDPHIQKHPIVKLLENPYTQSRLDFSKQLDSIKISPGARDDFELIYQQIINSDQALLNAIRHQYEYAESVPERLQQDRQFWRQAIQLNSRAFQYVPDHIKDFKLCQLAVRMDGQWLQDVPESLMNQELCEQAVENSGDAIKWVPHSLMNETMWLHAVHAKGSRFTLWDVPDQFKTRQVCLEAVQQNGINIEFVPHNLLDNDFGQQALRDIKGHIGKIGFYFKNLMTQSNWEHVVQRFGFNLHNIPKQFKNQQLYLKAITNNGGALQLVPKEFRTQELCHQAVKQNGCAIRSVPSSLLTEELCKLAVQQNGNILRWLPDYLKTQSVCQLAVKTNNEAMIDVPEEQKDTQMYQLAVENAQTDTILWSLPPHLRKNKELCLQVVANSGHALLAVPSEHRDEQLILTSIRNRLGQSVSVGEIPRRLLTPEFAEKIINTCHECYMQHPHFRQNSYTLFSKPQSKGWQKALKAFNFWHDIRIVTNNESNDKIILGKRKRQ